MKYKSFEEMPVWVDAMNLAVAIFNLTSTLPRSEDYSLTSQIRRSATSISANLAEGFGRSTPLDKAKFYVIARGSAYETINHLLYGTKVGYFETQIVDQLQNDLTQNIHDLNKIINFLKSKTESKITL